MLKLKFILVSMIFTTIFSGCIHSGRYQLIPVQVKESYQLFKLDKTTGDVWALDGENWKKIGDKNK